LSPLLFPLYIYDIDSIAEGVEGAITGSSTVQVTHMLYAYDLCLTANRPDQLQIMLNRLDEYAKRKGLTIDTAKSEVVLFNLHGFDVPAISVGGAPLANKDSFKYLGMVSTGPITLPNLLSISLVLSWLVVTELDIAREHHLIDRPHALLWLAKCYAIPTSMYARSGANDS